MIDIYGLVLEGGGTKGAYQMGVYKALMESGVEIGGVAGTSIGALNGAMIVQGDYEKAYELWHDITYSMIINADKEDIERMSQLKWAREDISFVKEKLKSLLVERGFDIGPFRESLEAYIDEDKIRKSKMDFGIVTINLSELKPLHIFKEDIPKGQLKDYLMASSYLPVFKAERMNGKIYLDGGFYDNLPFGMLQDKGYKDLIIVRVHGKGIVRRIDLGDSNSMIISPNEDLGRALDCDPTRTRYNLKLGYYDGLRALEGLKGERYYIRPSIDQEFHLNYLLKISEDDVNKMQDILKLPRMPYRRALFESIIPKIYSIISMDEEHSYEDLIIHLLEIKAEKLGIDRFKVYSFEELLNEAENINLNLPKEELNTLDKIIDKVDIMSLFNRDETLLKLSDIIIRKRV